MGAKVFTCNGHFCGDKTLFSGSKGSFLALARTQRKRQVPCLKTRSVIRLTYNNNDSNIFVPPLFHNSKYLHSQYRYTNICIVEYLHTSLLNSIRQFADSLLKRTAVYQVGRERCTRRSCQKTHLSTVRSGRNIFFFFNVDALREVALARFCCLGKKR